MKHSPFTSLKLVFVLGGSRSGKSTFALKEAAGIKGKKAFIATAEVLDEEMRIRIEKHKQERSKDWITYEEPLHISQLIKDIRDSYNVILIDCLTLWMSNIMHAGYDVGDEVKKLISIIADNRSASFYIISNEVGLGLVPESPLGREYRDNLGILNQEIARTATDVYFMVSGIPVKIK